MKTRFEHSAGGVVYRQGSDGFEIALASRRTRRGDLAWGLPKGLIEAGEAPEAAALREVREETGLEAEIRCSLGDIRYWYVWDAERIGKRVTFYLMRAVGGDVSLHDHEMEEVRWFPVAAAPGVTTHATERALVERAIPMIEQTEVGGSRP